VYLRGINIGKKHISAPKISGPGWSISAVEALITPERLSSYLVVTGNNVTKALALYEWNTHADAALMQTIALVEVIVRNALDRELMAWAVQRAGVPNWFDVAPLDSRGRQVLTDARRRATYNGHKLETHGKVIAELSLGFWRVLTASKYHTSLWVPNLHRAFPRGETDLRRRRVQVENLLRQISAIRNRAAHHEPVHHRNLTADRDLAVTIASWISTDAEAWVAAASILPEVIAERISLGL